MIYVICATATRLDHAKRIIENLLSTSDAQIAMVVGLYRSYFESLVDFKHLLPEHVRSRVELYFEPYSPSFSYSVNAGWGRIRNQVGSSENIIAIATTDDNEFREGWGSTALQCYKEQFPNQDGLMFLNDLRATTNIGRNGNCLVSAKFTDLYMAGWLVSPFYHCNGIDMEYAAVAEKHGKLGFCSDAEIYHLMVDWEHTQCSEHRLLFSDIFPSRQKRGFKYDFGAPWRYWR